MFCSTVYSYFDLFIAITKRSFNTKNVKEKRLVVLEKNSFIYRVFKLVISASLIMKLSQIIAKGLNIFSVFFKKQKNIGIPKKKMIK